MMTEAGDKLVRDFTGGMPFNPKAAVRSAVVAIEAEAHQQGFDAAWAESSIGVEGEIAEAVAARNAEIAEAVRGLLGHQVTGYEWECGTCAYDVKAGINRAPDGSPCPVDAFEDEAISRAAVLAIIEKP